MYVHARVAMHTHLLPTYVHIHTYVHKTYLPVRTPAYRHSHLLTWKGRFLCPHQMSGQENTQF